MTMPITIKDNQLIKTRMIAQEPAQVEPKPKMNMLRKFNGEADHLSNNK